MDNRIYHIFEIRPQHSTLHSKILLKSRSDKEPVAPLVTDSSMSSDIMIGADRLEPI